MNVEITANVGELLGHLAQFKDQAHPAFLRVLVRARDQAARPAMVDAVTAMVGLPKIDVEMAIRTKDPDPAAAAPVALLIASGARVPIIDFHAQESGSGVSYRLPGGRGFIPGAFIARMRSGHEGVFARRQPSVRRSPKAWSRNLPIVEQRGPSVGRIVQRSEEIQTAVRERTLAAVPQYLREEIAQLVKESELN